MKELNIQGNPGQNNTFTEAYVEGGSYNPAAREVRHYHIMGSGNTRMDAYFQNLLNEIDKGIKAEVFDDLEYYRTKLDGKKDVEEKLTDGGFKPACIKEAQQLKEMYAKKATKYECYPSAQKIILSLFARIKHEFETSIFPLIEQQQPLTIVMEQVRCKIVSPIMEMLETNGAHDHYLNFTEDHIYGMIYYLTGMCHLNWKDYDNI